MATLLGLQAGAEVKATTDCSARRFRALTSGVGVTTAIVLDVANTNPVQLSTITSSIASIDGDAVAAAASVPPESVAAVVVPPATILAFEAPSPPPPSPPPPLPPNPPIGCTLDFLRASSYYQNFEENPVAFGPDGNLVHEFMEMERIMHEQYTSITDEDPIGSNTAYTCRVANLNYMYECLDIAASSTLQDLYGQSTFDDSFTTPQGALDGNVFVHDNLMLEIYTPETLNVTNRPLFGMVAPCSGKTLGDGVINGFDSYVIVAAQFGLGAYDSLRSASGVWSPTDVETVQGRNDTKDRCALANYNRLEWQLRVAALPCFETGEEDAYTALAGRRLQDVEGPGEVRPSIGSAASVPVLQASGSEAAASSGWMLGTRVHEPLFEVAGKAHDLALPLDLTPAKANVGWSPFGLVPSTKTPVVDVGPVLLGAATSSGAAQGLQISVFEYAVTPKGTWHWINIPGIHAALELTLLGATNQDPIGMTNVRAPNYQSLTMPVDPGRYELRFIRHREFYDLDTHACAVIQSSRDQLYAMERGVLNIAQSLGTGYSLCGFDLVLWKPLGTPVYASGCEVRIEAGSVAMSAHGTSVQLENACSIKAAANEPPPSPSPAPPPPSHSPPLSSPPLSSPPPTPPGGAYGAELEAKFVIDGEVASFNETAFSAALLGAFPTAVGVSLSISGPSIVVNATLTFAGDEAIENAERARDSMEAQSVTELGRALDVTITEKEVLQRT